MLVIKAMETNEEKEGKARVHWQSWHETYTNLLPSDVMATYTLEQCLDWAYAYPDNVFVAKLEEKVVGFVCFGPSNQEAVGEIYALYVLAAYQGQGIGRRLLTAAYSQLEAYQTIVLSVLETNRSAVRFYEAFGFRADGCVTLANLDPSDKVIRMVLQERR